MLFSSKLIFQNSFQTIVSGKFIRFYSGADIFVNRHFSIPVFTCLLKNGY